MEGVEWGETDQDVLYEQRICYQQKQTKLYWMCMHSNKNKNKIYKKKGTFKFFPF